MNMWWEAAQDLDACFHDNKEHDMTTRALASWHAVDDERIFPACF